ncbi:MAG: Asp-tRNA(Asn)/Glu-tRNA(Gln) amidotransferase subunit GatB [Candidatus Xenobium sp.]|jgi:aspartyl-tRNA(Asn)/glutamyl-tRNA(Gln) amidotransferase subunit B
MSAPEAAGLLFETVIGLEVHVELATRTKLFCGCPNRYGAPPNSAVCPVCLGLPGALPVLNRRAVELLILAGRALGCKIAHLSKFDRKNYFYPDMSKNFQTSQYDMPLAEHGVLEFEVGSRLHRVRIHRIHLEEDAGKSIHVAEGRQEVAGRLGGSDYTLVDYNRAGVPLLEIVSEPDLRAPEEASAYLEALRDLLRWLEVSDCKMEEGSLRCDANVSLRAQGSLELGTKVEIKNMNSFRSVSSALAFEVVRQRELLERGSRIAQETRAWDEERGVTVSMRGKEHAHDYRYFPEPDLAFLVVDRAWLDRVDASIPELPAARARRYRQDPGLTPAQASWLTSSRSQADFFEAAGGTLEVATWMANELSRLARESGIDLAQGRLRPQALAEVLTLVDQGTISNKGARILLEHLFREGGEPAELVERLGLAQISGEDALREEVMAVLQDHPQAVEEFRLGKDKALNVLVGQLMKRTRGRANPQVARRLLAQAALQGEEG